MIFPVYIKFILLLLFATASIFFALIETSLTSLSKFRTKALMRKAPKKASFLRVWIENPNKLLTAILIGNTFANICASITATLLAIAIAEYYKIDQALLVGIASGLVTIIILVFCEITPKIFARQNPRKVALFLIRPLYIMSGILSPVIHTLVFISNVFIRLLGGKTVKNIYVFTDEEIRAFLDISADEGVIEKEENQMIKEVLDFGDTLVGEVMIPRMFMKCLDIITPSNKIIGRVIEIGYSRIPVFKNGLDEIVGILYSRDILNVLEKGELLSVENLLRPCFFVPENKKVMDLLAEFKKSMVHIAIVLDKRGLPAGLITLEDLLEEITGDIRDEHDTGRIIMKNQEDGTFTALAKESLQRVAIELGAKLPYENFTSLGDLILDLFGRIPKKGEEITFQHLRFIIEEASRKRVIRVKIIKLKL